MEPDYKKANNFYKHIKKKLKFDDQGKWDGKTDGIFGGLFHDVEELIYISLYPGKIDNPELREKFKHIFKNKLRSGSFTDFEVIVKEVEELATEIEDYKVLMLLHIQGISLQNFLFKTLKIDDIKYKYYGRNQIRGIDEGKVVDQIKFQANSKSTHYLQQIYRIVAKTKAISEQQAIDKVTNNFELVRAAYNYCECLDSRRGWSSYDDPLSKLKEPIAYIVISKDKSEPYYPLGKRFSPDEKSSFEALQGSRQKLYERYKRIIQQKNNTEIRAVIVRCLEILNEALDSNNKKTRFLAFYRICEYATGINIQRNHSDILMLISKYFNHEIGIAKGKLITDIRNKLVHEGKFYNYSDVHVNWIKDYAEAAMHILLWMDSAGFKSEEELAVFWEMYPDYRNNNLGNQNKKNSVESKVLSILQKELSKKAK